MNLFFSALPVARESLTFESFRTLDFKFKTNKPFGIINFGSCFDTFSLESLQWRISRDLEIRGRLPV